MILNNFFERKKTPNRNRMGVLRRQWPHLGSNQAPTDYESVALTE